MVRVVFEPEFMRRRDEYLREKARIGTLEDWRRFQRKWFDRKRWPEKTAEQLASESQQKSVPLRSGGRLWAHMTIVWDISPEARHELFSTLHAVGDPIEAPHLFEPPRGERWRQSNWSLQCGFCEISTFDDQKEAMVACPQCGRALYWVPPSE